MIDVIRIQADRKHAIALVKKNDLKKIPPVGCQVLPATVIIAVVYLDHWPTRSVIRVFEEIGDLS